MLWYAWTPIMQDIFAKVWMSHICLAAILGKSLLIGNRHPNHVKWWHIVNQYEYLISHPICPLLCVLRVSTWHSKVDVTSQLSCPLCSSSFYVTLHSWCNIPAVLSSVFFKFLRNITRKISHTSCPLLYITLQGLISHPICPLLYITLQGWFHIPTVLSSVSFTSLNNITRLFSHPSCPLFCVLHIFT